MTVPATEGTTMNTPRRRNEELAAWTPWPDAPFFETPPLLDRRLGQLLSTLRTAANRPGEFVPDGDLVETADHYVLDLDLPGVAKSDVTISVVGRRLIVRGTRNRPGYTGTLRYGGRLVGSFVFEVSLPDPVDDAAVTAKLSDGVLHIELPKVHQTHRTTITVD
jgi:HSP20 family protein